MTAGLSVVALILGVVTSVGLVARWLVRAGERAGDQPVDARSRLVAAPGGHDLVVANPGPAPVVVGVRVVGRRAAWLDGLRPHLVIRPARRSERRRHDRGATDVLGVVDAGDERRWRLAGQTRPTRVVVALGQAGCRLRVHEHLAGRVERRDLILSR